MSDEKTPETAAGATAEKPESSEVVKRATTTKVTTKPAPARRPENPRGKSKTDDVENQVENPVEIPTDDGGKSRGKSDDEKSDPISEGLSIFGW